MRALNHANGAYGGGASVVQARRCRHLSQGKPQISAAVRRGISVPPQQPRERRYFRSRDSRLLRHGHWQVSQLTENVASEIEWEQLEFSFEQQPNEGGYANKKR